MPANDKLGPQFGLRSTPGEKEVMAKLTENLKPGDAGYALRPGGMFSVGALVEHTKQQKR